MKTFTNYTQGARGINLKDGTTHWLEPGASAEIDLKEIVGEVPDLGKKPARADADDDALIASVEAENAELKKQVADLTKTVAERDAEIEKLKKAAKPA